MLYAHSFVATIKHECCSSIVLCIPEVARRNVHDLSYVATIKQISRDEKQSREVESEDEKPTREVESEERSYKRAKVSRKKIQLCEM